ncbi:hypothetical protein IAR55_000920 [Kwoniella newhampshirensis]|uniref:Zn(2)-C6 fungal-type domain-containing protein n=1 Tax=Kwoniella newhampshirensis TaxID=1651941 RepID=A0AAW0Z4H6_9TREE
MDRTDPYGLNLSYGRGEPSGPSGSSSQSNMMGMTMSRRNSLEMQNVDDGGNVGFGRGGLVEGLHYGSYEDDLGQTGPESGDGRASGSGKRQNQVQQQKRKKGTGSDEGRIKKTRQSPCRARKVKCDRPPPGSTNATVPAKDVCSHCAHLGLACTFDYKPKKRGPPNMYVRRLQGEGSAADTPPVSPAPLAPPSLSLSRQPSNPSPEILVTPISHTGLLYRENVRRERENWEPSLAMTDSHFGGGQSRSLGAGSGFYSQAMPLPTDSSPQQRNCSTSAVSSPLVTPNYSPYHSDNPRGGLPFLHSGQNSAQSSPLRIPHRLEYARLTNNPANPLDAMMPRMVLYQVVDLYFDYVYALIPSLHRPSFIRDLNARREEKPGQEEWISLVLVIVASTLVQLPRSLIAMTRTETRDLILRCHAVVKDYLAKDFELLTTTRINIIYHSVFVHRLTATSQVFNGQLGSIYTYMVALHMHEDKSYASWNPVQRELHRRIFWLMYGADKTVAAIDNVPTFMHEDYCINISLPSDLDDEFITEEGYLPQPEGYVSQLSGFCIVTKIHKMTGEILDRRRRDKVKPPHGHYLQMRIDEAEDLYDKLMALTDANPPQLRLDYKSDSRSVKSLSPDWDVKAKNDLRAIFADPHPANEISRDYFLVQQANIYVSQQFVRYTIIQYREELAVLQSAEEASRQAWSGTQPANPPRFTSDALRGNRSAGHRLNRSYQEERDGVIIDLLAILQKIPLKVLAVNTFPIVEKVRFVASALLDAIGANGPQHEPSAEETTAQKAQRNLWQFLSILSEIEALYSWTDDDGKPLL